MNFVRDTLVHYVGIKKDDQYALRIVTWFAHKECYWKTAVHGTSDMNRLNFDSLRSLQSRTSGAAMG